MDILKTDIGKFVKITSFKDKYGCYMYNIEFLYESYNRPIVLETYNINQALYWLVFDKLCNCKKHYNGFTMREAIVILRIIRNLINK